MKGLSLIEQAIYGTEGKEGYHFLARSEGFLDDWQAEGARLCTGFGERPAGISCPGCVFALPFARRYVAVVQVADQGCDDAGRPGALAFRLLIVPRRLYTGIGGDPFQIAEQYPPPWRERGRLSVLEWPGPFQPLPRTADQIRKILDVPYSSTLLGGVQALVDGGRLVFERKEPEPVLLRNLWALLPTATRGELWPASFAFCNAHGFHAVVVPRASGPEYENAVHEAHAGDYPEGRYESALQTAAECGDQHELDRLFARRSRSQTLRLAIIMFLAAPIIAIFLSPAPHQKPAPVPQLELPPVSACPPLDTGEREKLAAELAEIGARRNLRLPGGTSPAALMLTLEALDARLGTPDPRRDPGRRGRSLLAINALTLPPTAGPLDAALAVTFGPTGQLRDQVTLQRALRTLLWKHAIPEYNQRGLNTVELAERLASKLDAGANKP